MRLGGEERGLALGGWLRAPRYLGVTLARDLGRVGVLRAGSLCRRLALPTAGVAWRAAFL